MAITIAVFTIQIMITPVVMPMMLEARQTMSFIQFELTAPATVTMTTCVGTSYDSWLLLYDARFNQKLQVMMMLVVCKVQLQWH
jgi:hypothetical protein